LFEKSDDQPGLNATSGNKHTRNTAKRKLSGTKLTSIEAINSS